MSVESVSRTLCRVALIYCFSLFATAMTMAAALTTVDGAARSAMTFHPWSPPAITAAANLPRSDVPLILLAIAGTKI